MKTADAPAGYRDYPHVISQGVRRNRRWPIAVSNEAVPVRFVVEAYAFSGLGFVDGDGAVTDAGRKAILTRLAAMAQTSKASTCIVWSPNECTWLDAGGERRDGHRPPEGDLANPWVGRRQNAQVEWCWTIELPEGGEWSHLCVRRIDRDLVEIAPAEPMVLADFDEPAIDGLPDSAEGMLRKDGSLRPPRTYRGQRVTGVRDEWKLLGPVQAGDDGEILRNPWPADVTAACERVAGMALPKKLTDAAWRAVDPEHPGITYVGVQKAA